MQYRRFGSTDIELSAIGMGVMPLSVRQTRPDEQAGIGVIHHAVDCGITLFDTADSYCLDATEAGHNERILGKAVSQLPSSVREKLVLATKGGFVRPGGVWQSLGTPQHLRGACERSLTNLQVDCIDVYQYHTIDRDVPLADSIGELRKLKDEGKIRHVAVSNFDVVEIDQAAAIVPIVSVQNQYSRRQRAPEKDGTLAGSKERDMAFIPWSPLNGMGGSKTLGKGDETVNQIAADRGVSVYQVALAWLLSKGPMVFPIPGASRKASIEDSAKAAELHLSAEAIAQLDGR